MKKIKGNLSVGLDVVEVARIGRLIRRPAFLRRVFTPQEVAYCRRFQRPAERFAVRFAAKEATWKAISASGLRTDGISHRDIGVVNDPSGRPAVAIRGRPSLARRISISLSHAREFAAAVAILR